MFASLRNPPPPSICPGGERPTQKLSEGARQVLKSWMAMHQGHPYPSKAEKERLGRETGLSPAQIKTWFANSRRRLQHRLARSGSSVGTPSRSHSSSEERPPEESLSEETGDEVDLWPVFEDISPVKGQKALKYVCSERHTTSSSQNNLTELSRLCNRIGPETAQQGVGSKQQAPATELQASKTLCDTAATPSSTAALPCGEADVLVAGSDAWKQGDRCMSSRTPDSILSRLSTQSSACSAAHCSPISSVESSPCGSPARFPDRDAATTRPGYTVQPPPSQQQSKGRSTPPLLLQTSDFLPVSAWTPALWEGRSTAMQGFVEAEATTTTTRWRGRLGVHDAMTTVLGSPDLDPFPLPPFPTLPGLDPYPPLLGMPLFARRPHVVDRQGVPAVVYPLQPHITQLPLDLSLSQAQPVLASSLEDSSPSPPPGALYHTLTPLSLPACLASSSYPESIVTSASPSLPACLPSSSYPKSLITTTPLAQALGRQAGLSQLARDARPSLLHPGVIARPFPGSAVSRAVDRLRERSARKEEEGRWLRSRRRRFKVVWDDSRLPELERSADPSRSVEVGDEPQWMHACNRARCLKRAASALKRKSVQEMAGSRSQAAKKPRPNAASDSVHMEVRETGSAASNLTRPTVIVSSASSNARVSPLNSGSFLQQQGSGSSSSSRSFTNNSRGQGNSTDILAENTLGVSLREQNQKSVVAPSLGGKESKQTTSSEKTESIPCIQETSQKPTVSTSGPEKSIQAVQGVEDCRVNSVSNVDHIILNQPEVHLDRATAPGHDTGVVGTLTVRMEAGGASIDLSSPAILAHSESEVDHNSLLSPDAERSFRLKINFTGPVYIVGKMVQTSAVNCQQTSNNNGSLHISSGSTVSIASRSETVTVGSSAASLPNCFNHETVIASSTASSSYSVNAARSRGSSTDASCQTSCCSMPASSRSGHHASSTGSPAFLHSATCIPCSRNDAPCGRQPLTCHSTESASTKSSTSSRATSCLEEALSSVAATVISRSQSTIPSGPCTPDLHKQSTPAEIAWIKDGTTSYPRQDRETRKCESNYSASEKGDRNNQQTISGSGGNSASVGLHLKTPVLQALLMSSSPASLHRQLRPPLSRSTVHSEMDHARQSLDVLKKTSAGAEYTSVAQKKSFICGRGSEGKQCYENAGQNGPSSSMEVNSFSNEMGKRQPCLSPSDRGSSGGKLKRALTELPDTADLMPVKGCEEARSACHGPCSFLTGRVETLAHNPRHQAGDLKKGVNTDQQGGGTSCLSGGLVLKTEDATTSYTPFPPLTRQEKTSTTANGTLGPGKQDSRRRQEVAQALLDMSAAKLP